MVKRVNILKILGTIFSLLVFSAPLYADRILVIADSWSPGVASGLQSVLQENGYMDITVEGIWDKGEARQLGSPDGLNYVSILLSNRPDTIIVHLQIGGNDWLRIGWTPAWSSQMENNLIEDIIQDVETVVDHILSLRPDIQILWSSYDFFRPINRGTPAEVNGFQIRMAEQMAQFALTKPGLSFVDVNGTLQLTYGFDGFQYTEFDPDYVIPPGDPSLPDPGFPSPIWAFLFQDTQHLTPGGYRAVARAQYDGYYATQLGGEIFHINAGLNDAWFNQATAGQGFLFTVYPDIEVFFLAWFTFELERPDESITAMLGEPGHRWLTAYGTWDGNTVTLIIEKTSGGVFDSPTPPIDPQVDYGTITIVFHDCNNATLTYDIPSPPLAGTIELSRGAPDNIELCMALNTQ